MVEGEAKKRARKMRRQASKDQMKAAHVAVRRLSNPNANAAAAAAAAKAAGKPPPAPPPSSSPARMVKQLSDKMAAVAVGGKSAGLAAVGKVKGKVAQALQSMKGGGGDTAGARAAAAAAAGAAASDVTPTK